MKALGNLVGCFVLGMGAHFAVAQLPPIPIGSVSVEVQTIATGLTSPVELVSANDGTGRLFIVEQNGRIRVLKNGALNATPFLDVTTQVKFGGEQGLLGLAFHPGFSNSASPGYRKLYTYWTVTPSGTADFSVPMSGSPSNHILVTEWQVSASNADVVDISTRRDVVRITHPQDNHDGGKIAFSPLDAYLYIAIGDGGNGNDVGDGHTANLGNGQDTSNLLGKILRIDPVAPALTQASTDAVGGNGKYRIPKTNPFVGAAGLDEIYAYGFRNPYRFSFNPTDKQLLVGDVGQGAIEEVDIVEAGKNYGWNKKEGSFLFNPANGSVSVDPNPNPALVNPTLEYDHGDGISVIGGFFYRGAGVPALVGKYVFGDFFNPPSGAGRLFYADLNTRVIQELRLGVNPRSLGLRIKSFGSDADGELYIMADNSNSTAGQVLKIVSIPAVPALLNLSTRGRVETDDQGYVIAGFILTGSAPKNIAIRGIGPSLKLDGQPLPARLANPTLTLFDSAATPLATNDDWMTGPRRQELIDSNLAPTDPAESGIVATLQPGAYTATLRGVNGTGIGSVELYDLQQGAPANAVNLSTRGRVQTGNDVLIGGLIVGGSGTQRVMLRAIGPALSARNVSGVLQNPTLQLVNASGTQLASNDNWRSDQATEITASGLAPTNDAESAIIATLSPANYTAIVRGAGNTSGVALVEVYRLNP